MHLVVMGVSGSGKSTVAQRLAERLGLVYAEADRFHTPQSIAKMESGVPLQDEDRFPWLSELARWIHQNEVAGVSGVLACSALKRSYRDLLRTGGPDVRFVHLNGSSEVIGARLGERSGHFMPAGLLDSQLKDLQPLEPDESGVAVDVAGSPDEVTGHALRELGLYG